ncbi:hypothetical protein BH23ACT2_BH23ACT2_07280 [soil metagenome]
MNRPGGTHQLPAVILASVCGHVAGTGTYRLSREQLREAIDLLTPAEAATHIDHQNLRSWRELARDARGDTVFIALFVRDLDDEPVDGWDAEFRKVLG